jgi:hypothetical protein
MRIGYMPKTATQSQRRRRGTPSVISHRCSRVRRVELTKLQPKR